MERLSRSQREWHGRQRNAWGIRSPQALRRSAACRQMDVTDLADERANAEPTVRTSQLVMLVFCGPGFKI